MRVWGVGAALFTLGFAVSLVQNCWLNFGAVGSTSGFLPDCGFVDVTSSLCLHTNAVMATA